MNKRLFKHPVFIIFCLFIAGYFFIQQYVEQQLSDEPVVLTRADPPSIIMYSSQSCMYCHIAKQFFAKHNLPYTEYDIDNSLENRDTFAILGGRGTPLLIINKQIIHGYDERLIREAL
jgi:glutaredoxin